MQDKAKGSVISKGVNLFALNVDGIPSDNTPFEASMNELSQKENFSIHFDIHSSLRPEEQDEIIRRIKASINAR